MLASGVKAPEFSLPGMDDGQVTLAGLIANGPVLLALYKSSCPVCQLTLPYLQRIAQGSLPVVMISQDNQRETERFRDKFSLTMPALLDRAEDRYPVSNAFGITNVPSLFLIEQDGTISHSGSGFRKTELEDLGRRSGVPVFTPEDKVPEWKAG